MTEPSPSSAEARSRRVPLGLVGALLLIFVTERAITRLDLWLMTPDQWIFRTTAKRLNQWVKGRDVLIFGDSQAKLAISPVPFEPLAQKSGYNLALSGSQAANSYFLLRRALASGARPSIVLIDFFPPLQRLSHWHVVENDPYLMTIGEAFELAREAKDPGFFASILARKTLASFRNRQSIRTLVQNQVTEQGVHDWASPTHIFLRNHVANQGAQVHPIAEPASVDLDRFNADYFPRWEVAKVQETYIQKFLELAQKHQIQVAWVLTPFQKPLQERTEKSGFDDRWTGYVGGWLDRFPGLTVIDGRGVAYPGNHYFDPNHLAHLGTAAFSDEVARILPSLPGRSGESRWVRLHGPKSARGEDRLEDLTATGMLIRQESTASQLGRQIPPDQRIR